MLKLFNKYKNLKIVVFFTILLVLIGLFLGNEYYFATASIFVINSLLITSLMLIIGYAGQISLAHGAIYGIGAYTSAILTTKLGVPFLFALLASALAGLLVSLIVGAPSLKLKGHYLAMATLGVGEIIVILFQELDFLTGGVNGFIGIKPAEIFGYTFANLKEYYLLVSVVATSILAFFAIFVDSKIGRALRAIKSSEIAASSLGLNPSFYKILVFGLSGAVAGSCGSLYAHLDRFISPSTFSVSFSVMMVAMVIVGGESSFVGSLAAALIFSLLNEYVRQFQELSQFLFGFGLFIVAIFMKGGFGNIRKLFT